MPDGAKAEVRAFLPGSRTVEEKERLADDKRVISEGLTWADIPAGHGSKAPDIRHARNFRGWEHVTLQNAGLNSRAQSHNLIRINADIRLLAEKFLHFFKH